MSMSTITEPAGAVADSAGSIYRHTVPTDYRKHGWRYRQLRRVGNFAIYSQGGGVAFEVVRIRMRPACFFKGSRLPEREYLPSDSEWGRHGWTMHTLEEAETKMAVLTLADDQNPNLPAQPPECGHAGSQPAQWSEELARRLRMAQRPNQS